MDDQVGQHRDVAAGDEVQDVDQQHREPSEAEGRQPGDQPDCGDRSGHAGLEPGRPAERDPGPEDGPDREREQQAEAGQRVGQGARHQGGRGRQPGVAHRERVGVADGSGKGASGRRWSRRRRRRCSSEPHSAGAGAIVKAELNGLVQTFDFTPCWVVPLKTGGDGTTVTVTRPPLSFSIAPAWTAAVQRSLSVV